MEKTTVKTAKKTSNKDLLQRITNHLILHSSFTDNIGLYHGKMGIVLTFSVLAKRSGNEMYSDYAGDLLDEIYEDIQTDSPIDMENGLCGIGWGINYLLQNGYMEGEPDEVLEEIDKKIMERDLRRISDYSFLTGLSGISYYIESRINFPKRKKGQIPFDIQYLADWNFIKDKVTNSEQNLIQSISKKTPSDDNITTWPLGIENGCAGFILKSI